MKVDTCTLGRWLLCGCRMYVIYNIFFCLQLPCDTGTKESPDGRDDDSKSNCYMTIKNSECTYMSRCVCMNVVGAMHVID